MSGAGGGFASREVTCTYVSPCGGVAKTKKPEEPKYKKAVFMRPCPGELYATDAFSSASGALTASGLKTTVGGGTLKSVCRDLRDSGVTDIFLPFKVDDEGNAPLCGKYGQLLYSSTKYPRHVSSLVTDANALGVDPVGSVISVCESEYGSKRELRFHAWFPVFKDPYAAESGGVSGTVVFPRDESTDWIPRAIRAAKDIWNAIFPTKHTSHLFADPANTTVTDYELEVLGEIVSSYGSLDGINLDYIRYPDSTDVLDVSEPGISAEPFQIDGQDVAVTWDIDSSAVTSFTTSVKQKFSSLVVSADVFASEGARSGIGQEGVPGEVDWIMPMEYAYLGFGGSDDVQLYTSELRAQYPTKVLIPLLRGWLCTKPDCDSIPESETPETFIDHVAADIAAAKTAKADGYGIFDYEAILMDSTIPTSTDSKLKKLKSKLGW
jgi:hypothetical protein